MSVVARRPSGGPLLIDVRAAVVVEEERRVDAVDLGQPDRLRPRARRILRGDDEVAAAVDERVDHVERAGVVADRRREDAARDPQRRRAAAATAGRARGRSASSGRDPAAEDRHAREVREARVDEVVVVADANDARIGIEAREDRVGVLVRARRVRVVYAESLPAYSNQSKRATGAPCPRSGAAREASANAVAHVTRAP